MTNYPPHRRPIRQGTPGFRSMILGSLNLSPSWLRQLERNPLRTIIRKAPYGALSHLIRHVYRFSPGDKVFQEMERAVENQPEMISLRKKPDRELRQSGLDEDQSKGLQFLAQLSKLHKIADLGGTRYFPWVQDEIVKLMHFQNNDGRFPLLYHHHGHACWVLIRLGLEGNRILDRGFHWIAERQRKDGGWLHRTMKPAGRSYDQTASCYWTTAEIVQALSIRKTYRHKECTRSGCEFLLDHILKRGSTSFLSDIDAFNHLQIGNSGNSMFYGGSLKVLEASVNSGLTQKDPRVRKLVKWLFDIQLDNGMFPRIANNIPMGDHFVTVRVLQLFRKLSEQH